MKRNVRQALDNIKDAVNELRHTGSAWMEISFAAMAVAAGAWAYFFPYVSGWFELPRPVATSVFLVAGGFKLLAFFMRDIRRRMNASVVSCAIWAGVSWILIMDRVPGWMTATAPVITVFEFVVWHLLFYSQVRGGRRHSDAGMKGSGCG